MQKKKKTTPHYQEIKVRLLTYSTPQKVNRANVRAACLQPPPLESKKAISGAAAGPLSPLRLLEAPPADVQEGKASFQVGRIFPPSAT